MKTWPKLRIEARIQRIAEGKPERMSPTYKQLMKKLRKENKRFDRRENGQRSWLRP